MRLTIEVRDVRATLTATSFFSLSASMAKISSISSVMNLTLVVAGVRVDELPSWEVIWSSLAYLAFMKIQAINAFIVSLNSVLSLGFVGSCWIKSWIANVPGLLLFSAYLIT